MIYLISCDGFTKIGFTEGEPMKRLKELQCGSPHEMRLLLFGHGDKTLEGLFHTNFAEKRVRGEWFLLSDDDIRNVAHDLADLGLHMGIKPPTPVGPPEEPIHLGSDGESPIDLG